MVGTNGGRSASFARAAISGALIVAVVGVLYEGFSGGGGDTGFQRAGRGAGDRVAPAGRGEGERRASSAADADRRHRSSYGESRIGTLPPLGGSPARQGDLAGRRDFQREEEEARAAPRPELPARDSMEVHAEHPEWFEAGPPGSPPETVGVDGPGDPGREAGAQSTPDESPGVLIGGQYLVKEDTTIVLQPAGPHDRQRRYRESLTPAQLSAIP